MNTLLKGSLYRVSSHSTWPPTWPHPAAFCTSVRGWCLHRKFMHIMLFLPLAFRKGPQDTGPILSSSFLHSICLNGSGCGEQMFSIVLYVRRPYPAKHETAWWFGKFCHLLRTCSILTFGRTHLIYLLYFLLLLVLLLVDLAYCWLIICKAHIILLENAVEKPQGPHHMDGIEHTVTEAQEPIEGT